MNKTKIEYLTHTWNPIAMRCDPVSEGCTNCWHLGMAKRLAGREGYKLRDAYAGKSPPVLVESRLDEPLRMRGVATIGVQFMGDLFHADVPFDFVDKVMKTIIDVPWHTFIILTKRAERMYDYFYGENITDYSSRPVPFPNVIGMVTAENQEQADKRIPWLLKTPFAVRGVSVEPMLSSISVKHYFDLNGGGAYFRGLDWIVNGSETGPGARPMSLDWARSLRDQCLTSNTPFFFKRDSDGSRTLDGVMWEQYPETSAQCYVP